MKQDSAHRHGAHEVEALRHAMVEQLMAVIGLPDDEEVAERADAVVAELDALMPTGPTSA